MTFDRRLYPDDWLEMRQRVLDRADNRCEWCGAMNHQRHPLTGSRVVLTIAHLAVTLPDGTVVSKHDKGHRHESALAALCQRCHLNYDRQDHIRHAAETRLQRKLAAGQAVLLEAAAEGQQ